MYVNIIFIDEK